MLPIIKEIDAIGGAFPATRERILEQLALGKQIVLCPGGLREIPGLDPERCNARGFVERDGFIRIAKAANVPIIPVFAADELACYPIVWLWWPKLQRWLLSKILYPWFVVALSKKLFWPTPPEPMRVIYGPVIETKHKSIPQIRKEFYSRFPDE